MGKQNKPKEGKEILREQIEEVLKEYNRPNNELFLSAFTAGLEIGFSVLLIGVLYQMFSRQVSDSSLHLILGLAYPIGFIFIIIGRSVLFTEQTTLAILPFLDRKTSLYDLIQHWIVIYCGNLLGGFIFAVGVVFLGQQMDIISQESFQHLAHKLTSFDGTTILVSALFAGWLMGLLSWLLTAARETISRIVLVIIVTSVIGIAGLHHSIVGSIEVLSGLLSGGGIMLADYGKFQFFTTLGNIIGGVVFVGMLKFSHFSTK